MKYFFTVLVAMFFFCQIKGEKKVVVNHANVVQNFILEIPTLSAKYDLLDFRNSSGVFSVRIWQENEIFTISSGDTLSCNYKVHADGDTPIFTSYNSSEEIAKMILDSLFLFRIQDFKGETFPGLDDRYVFIEISTPSEYKVLSYWSPNFGNGKERRCVTEILNMLRTHINVEKIRSDFIASLSPGEYIFGANDISVDQFVNEGTEKSDFYKYAESRIRAELNISNETSTLKFPLVFVNNKRSTISEMNKFTKKDIKHMEILQAKSLTISLYGEHAKNGVVKLETK